MNLRPFDPLPVLQPLHHRDLRAHSNEAVIEVVDLERASRLPCGLQRLQEMVLPEEAVGDVDFFEVGEQLLRVDVAHEALRAALQVMEGRDVCLRRRGRRWEINYM